jgi:hypothetical protein
MADAYLKDVEFDGLVDNALETTKRTLQRDFDIVGTLCARRPASIAPRSATSSAAILRPNSASG